MSSPRTLGLYDPFLATAAQSVSPLNFNPRVFGAVGNGIADDTAAFTACWNAALAVPRAVIEVPAGAYRITAGLPPLLNSSSIDLIFDGGGQSAYLVWEPILGGNQACVTVQPAPATTLVNGVRISGLGIKSSSGVTKTGLRLIATSASHYDNLYIQLLHAGDTALELQGYDTSAVSDCFFEATYPIRCNKITVGTAAGQGPLDHWNFHNVTLFSFDDTQPLISFESGASMTNCSLTGYHSWLGGSDGIVFHSANFFTDNHFENVRWENSGAQLATPVLHGFMFDVAPSLGLFNTFRNCRGGAVGQQGFKFRIMDYVTMDAVLFDGTWASAFTQIDADNTCDHLLLLNVHFGDQLNATRAIGSSLVNMFSAPGDTFTATTSYPLAYYAKPSVAGVDYAAAMFYGQPVYKSLPTIATGGATAALPSPGAIFAAGNAMARITVVATQADLGGGTVEYGNVIATYWGVTLVSGSANFAVTDTAGKLCLLYNGATGAMTLKNNLAVIAKAKVIID